MMLRLQGAVLAGMGPGRPARFTARPSTVQATHPVCTTRHPQALQHKRRSTVNRSAIALPVRAAVQQASEAGVDDDELGDTQLLPGVETNSEHIGPAFRATLTMLEWRRVCEHVADFASTSAGRRACQALAVPATQEESEELLRLTRWVCLLPAGMIELGTSTH